LNEYLASYRPDREFVDGEIRERNVGKWEHARVQWLLAAWFLHEKAWGASRVARNRGFAFPTTVFVFPIWWFSRRGRSRMIVDRSAAAGD
jgi:hypothetical protein